MNCWYFYFETSTYDSGHQIISFKIDSSRNGIKNSSENHAMNLECLCDANTCSLQLWSRSCKVSDLSRFYRWSWYSYETSLSKQKQKLQHVNMYVRSYWSSAHISWCSWILNSFKSDETCCRLEIIVLDYISIGWIFIILIYFYKNPSAKPCTSPWGVSNGIGVLLLRNYQINGMLESHWIPVAWLVG